MEQQREELDQLVVERKKLLAIQGQLQKLQQEFPGVSKHYNKMISKNEI